MKRSAWKTIGHWIMVGIAAWLLISGLFAWVTINDRMTGAVRALSLGLPPWHLIVPLYGAVSLALLLTRRPGAYWYLGVGNIIFAFAVGIPLIASWEPLAKRTGMEATIWSALIFILALLVSLLSLVMMLTEMVPLNAFAARIAYLGRLGHLRGLYALAGQRGWQATGPRAPEHSVFVTGHLDGRDVTIQSAEPMLGSLGGSTQGFYYWVTVAAKSVLPPMAVAVGRPLPKPDETTRELRGKCRTAGKLMMDFYVWPQEGERLQPGAMDRIAAELDRGRRFLRTRSVVYTEYNTIYYGRANTIRITDDTRYMAQLVDWLAGLAALLEQELILQPDEPEVDAVAEEPSGVAEALEMDRILAGLGAAPEAAAEPAPVLPPEAAGAESLARRAALAVLLTIGFYGLALGIAAVLLFIVYADVFLLRQIQLRLVLVCLAAAGIIIWSVLPRRDRFEAPGPRLLPADHPGLFAEVAALAQQLGQAPPSEVYLAPDVNAGVMERGGIMGIGRKRVMLIGLPLLQMLTVDQVRGVVAHEFGHFYGGDTRLGPWIYKTRETIGRTIRNIGKGSWLQAPFRWYGLMFLRTTHAISRRQEYVADRLAAGIVGPQTYSEGLCVIAGGNPAFQAYMQEEYVPALESGHIAPFLDGFARFTRTARITEAMARYVAAEAQAAESDPYDTHPSLRERLVALAALPPLEPGRSPEPGGFAEPGVVLLGDARAAEVALVRSLVHPEYRDQLPAVSWEELGAKAYLPRWEKVTRTYAAGLAGYTVATLPALLAGAGPLADEIRRQAGRTPLQQEIDRSARTVAGAALAAALAHHGWTVDAAPGIPITLRRDGDAVEPFEICAGIAGKKPAGEAWAQRCRDLGIADIDLAGGVAAQPTLT